jgi:hypothetical protein
MLDSNDPEAPPGPVFVVDAVAEFHAGRPPALSVVEEPTEIPGGFQAVYREPGGGTIYVIDQSTDSAAS